MKLKVTMKDPDCLYDAAKEAAEDELKNIQGLDDDEREDLLDGKIEKLMDLGHEWFKWGEYLTVEIDTEARTCTVIPVSE